MRVLYCNPSFWEYRLPFYSKLNEFFGGDFHIIYSTKRFRKGHEKLLHDTLEVMGENAHPYDNELMYDVKTRSFSGYSEEYKQIPLPFGLWKRISNVKPEVLITEAFFQWTPLVQLWALLHRVPVFVGYERTLWTERNNSKLKTLIRKIQDKLIKGYLVNGKETRKYLESIGVKPEKIHEIGMSADSTGLRSSIAAMSDEEKKTFKNKFKRGEQGLIYLFTGKLIERKGVMPLLKAWKEHIANHPQDSLVMVGDGELFEQCKAECADCPSVFLEGRVDYSLIHRYYAIADVYFLPTIEDNWSLVIPEAMACGLPVATSIYNGCHVELIHHNTNGCTFDTFSQDSMTRALDFFHNKDLNLMGDNSVKIEENYNTETCAKREYEAIMTSCKN